MVHFRKYRKDFKALARELLAEIAIQIKSFFLSKKIYPNPPKLGLRGARMKKEDIIIDRDAIGNLV